MKIATNKHLKIAIASYIVGVLLQFSCSFYQDYRRYVALLGFLMFIYGIFNVPRLIAVRYYPDKISKYLGIYLLVSILFSFVVIFSWFKYQDYNLGKYGIKTKAVIVDKDWVGKRRGGYQITYSFNYNSKLVRTKRMTDEYKIGDTISIIFMPNKPIHNEIINK